MRLARFDKNVCLFRLGRKDGGERFIFDIQRIPDKPIPKKIVFQDGGTRRIRRWSMSWQKFLNQTAIGNVAMIDKDKCHYSTWTQKKP